MKKQSATFLEGGADNYVLLNKAALDSRATSESGFFEIDWLVQALTQFKG